MLAAAPVAHAAALTTAQIDAIVSLLQSFGADAATIANVQASLTGGTPTAPSGGGTSACSFTRDLTLGASGADVTCLQNALIAAGYGIPAISSGVAAPGYFGSQTQTAVSHGKRQAASLRRPVTSAPSRVRAGILPVVLPVLRVPRVLRELRLRAMALRSCSPRTLRAAPRLCKRKPSVPWRSSLFRTRRALKSR